MRPGLDRSDAGRPDLHGAVRVTGGAAHGAAYDAFGAYERKIDGLPDGLPAAVADLHFTGFHRVEYGLWHGESASSLASSVDELAGDVQALRDIFPTVEVDPLDLGLRAHEILEDTLQLQLTGDADQGSAMDLATASANLDGTQEVLTVLRSLLVPRYPNLSEVDVGLLKVRGYFFSLPGVRDGTDYLGRSMLS